MGENFALTTRLAQEADMNIPPKEALKFRISFPQKTVRNCSHHLDKRHEELCSLETQNKSGLSLVLFSTNGKKMGQSAFPHPITLQPPLQSPSVSKDECILQ